MAKKPQPKGQADVSKAYKLRTEEAEAVKETMVQMIIKKKTPIRESDVLHALVRYHLKNLSADEVLKYRQEELGLDE